MHDFFNSPNFMHDYAPLTFDATPIFYPQLTPRPPGYTPHLWHDLPEPTFSRVLSEWSRLHEHYSGVCFSFSRDRVSVQHAASRQTTRGISHPFSGLATEFIYRSLLCLMRLYPRALIMTINGLTGECSVFISTNLQLSGEVKRAEYIAELANPWTWLLIE